MTFDTLDAELAEIDENLHRNELTVLEQAERLLRRNEILEALGLRAKQGDNRYTNGRGVTVTPLQTTTAIAADMGMSKNSAQKRLQIARNLTPEVKESVAGTEIANSTTRLLKLARLADRVTQKREAERLARALRHRMRANYRPHYRPPLATAGSRAKANTSVQKRRAHNERVTDRQD